MEPEILYNSEFIIITRVNNDFFIQSLKAGMSINIFNDVLKKFTQIKITDFMAIKSTLMSQNNVPIKFGEGKQRISIEISPDLMRAYAVLTVDESEFKGSEFEKLTSEISGELAKKDIKAGIKLDLAISENLLCNGKHILIAEGTSPINGNDSIVKNYSFVDSKPKISEDQSANFYELDIINSVQKDEYLCEWSLPTLGIPGKNIKGEVIDAAPGKLFTIIYDKSSIYEKTNNGITSLYAIKKGAVELENGNLIIKDHLEIKENVNFNTGNINFDGCVTIKGSVEDNFSVVAKNDIEVLSAQGLGCIKEIISTNGSVFIKGGVSGKGKSIIKAAKNVFIKYANDTTITCGGDLNIGSYAFNCNIEANRVIVESSNGQICGGKANVISKVSCARIGSTSEALTIIKLKGINREAININIAKLIKDINDAKLLLSKYEKDLAASKGNTSPSIEQTNSIKEIMNNLIETKSTVKELENDKKQMQEVLKIKGDCELYASKNIYPHSVIFFTDEIFRVEEIMGSSSLYYEGNEIKQK